MERKKVAVLFGGCSTEYEVSLQSAYSVITNMDPDKYEAVLIGITKDGRWYRYYGETENISKNTGIRTGRIYARWFPDKTRLMSDGCV